MNLMRKRLNRTYIVLVIAMLSCSVPQMTFGRDKDLVKDIPLSPSQGSMVYEAKSAFFKHWRKVAVATILALAAGGGLYYSGLFGEKGSGSEGSLEKNGLTDDTSKKLNSGTVLPGSSLVNLEGRSANGDDSTVNPGDPIEPVLPNIEAIQQACTAEYKLYVRARGATKRIPDLSQLNVPAKEATEAEWVEFAKALAKYKSKIDFTVIKQKLCVAVASFGTVQIGTNFTRKDLLPEGRQKYQSILNALRSLEATNLKAILDKFDEAVTLAIKDAEVAVNATKNKKSHGEAQDTAFAELIEGPSNNETGVRKLSKATGVIKAVQDVLKPKPNKR